MKWRQEDKKGGENLNTNKHSSIPFLIEAIVW